MAEQNFDPIMDDEIFPSEGGYVNDKHDPGGETNLGISKRSYPNEDIAGMTRARAKAIYRRDFWNKVQGDRLPPGVDLVAMDAAVNSGVKRSVKWLQASTGLTGIAVDGIMGPATLGYISAHLPATVIKKACAARLGFMRGLTTWSRYGKGWSKRVARVEAKAISMALGGGERAKTALLAEANAAKKQAVTSATNATAGAAGAAGSIGTGVGLDTGHIDPASLPQWAWFAISAALTVLIFNYIGRARHDSERAKALAAEAQKGA